MKDGSSVMIVVNALPSDPICSGISRISAERSDA